MLAGALFATSLFTNEALREELAGQTVALLRMGLFFIIKFIVSRVQITILCADYFCALIFELTIELERKDMQEHYRVEARRMYDELLATENDSARRRISSRSTHYTWRHFLKDLFGEKVYEGREHIDAAVRPAGRHTVVVARAKPAAAPAVPDVPSIPEESEQGNERADNSDGSDAHTDAQTDDGEQVQTDSPEEESATAPANIVLEGI